MTISFKLSEDQFTELENLSALGYSADQMALYFGVDKHQFLQASLDVDSPVYYHIQRGAMVYSVKEHMAIIKESEGGDVKASERLGKIRRTRNWEISKTNLFSGFDCKKSIQTLENYLQGGSLNKLSNQESIYLEALTLFHSLYRKVGRRHTIQFFTKTPFNLTYARSSEMFDEAVNLFYTDRNVEKKAIRNLYAEQVEEAAHLVRENAVSAKEFEIFSNMMMQAAKLRELDKPDPEVLSKEMYQKPVRIFSLDPASVGIPKIDRQEVAGQIEILEIPERDKIRLQQDAMLQLINIEENLHELQEESQGE